MTFAADGVTLNFLGVGELRCFQTSLSFCIRIKVMDSFLIMQLLSCREKFVAGLASDKDGQCKHRHDFASVRPL